MKDYPSKGITVPVKWTILLLIANVLEWRQLTILFCGYKEGRKEISVVNGKSSVIGRSIYKQTVFIA